MAKQKGGNLYGALWTGTAFFAASKARTYTDFLKSFAMYSVVVIGIMLAGWVIMRAIGREGFVQGAFGQCTNGGVVVEENGQKVCKTDKSTVVMTE